MAYKILKPEITNVYNAAWSILKKRWDFWVVVVISTLLSVSTAIILAYQIYKMQRLDQLGVLFFSFWPSVLVVPYFIGARAKMTSAFWKQVAEINAWQYKGCSDPVKELGIMFRQGHSRSISRVSLRVGSLEFLTMYLW